MGDLVLRANWVREARIYENYIMSLRALWHSHGLTGALDIPSTMRHPTRGTIVGQRRLSRVILVGAPQVLARPCMECRIWHQSRWMQ